MRRILFVLMMVGMMLLGVGCEKRVEDVGERVTVTNTYLGSVVRDVVKGDVVIESLAKAGSCPGHFDLTPGQVEGLMGSCAVVRFGFQGGLDGVLERTGIEVVSVKGEAGMCVPESYAAMCDAVRDALAGKVVVKEEGAVRERMAGLEEAVRKEMKEHGLAGMAVIAAEHQAVFAKWLGFDVVAAMKGGDRVTMGNMEDCLEAGRDAGVRLIIANRQSGVAMAERFGGELGAAVVVLSNFPEEIGETDGGFDGLVRENVRRIVEAAGEIEGGK